MSGAGPTEDRTVGIVGLGLMGAACSQRLASAGFALLGYDVDGARCAAFAGPGRACAASPAQLAADCGAIVLAVYDTDQVEQALFGEQGIAAAARASGRAPAVVCISTCDPERIAAIGQRCAGQGLPFIEAPISGTSQTLAKGEAVGLVAGREADLTQARPVLDALCPRRHVLGAPGNASKAKLAVNLVLGLNRGAMAEGLLFAERLGLAPQDFLQVLIGSAAYSRVMEVKGAAMAQRRFDPPQSRVDQSLKDFGLILAQAGGCGQSLPFAEVYAELLRDCVREGEALLDNAIIIEAIARRRRN